MSIPAPIEAKPQPEADAPRDAAPAASKSIAGPRDLFGRCAAWTTKATGGRWGFLTALFVVILWAAAGPLMKFSELWQMIINTMTSVVTFLMVFLIQNAQNRESKAIHLKLNELIFALSHARNELIHIEDVTEAQLDRIARAYSKVAQTADEEQGAASLRSSVDPVEVHPDAAASDLIASIEARAPSLGAEPPPEGSKPD